RFSERRKERLVTNEERRRRTRDAREELHHDIADAAVPICERRRAKGKWRVAVAEAREARPTVVDDELRIAMAIAHCRAKGLHELLPLRLRDEAFLVVARRIGYVFGSPEPLFPERG